MRHAKRLAVAVLALGVASALAACGSGGNGTTAESSADVVGGDFAAVAGAPASDSKVSGEARLERNAGATTIALDLSGLAPKTDYVAHLHTGGCDSDDPGGPHFQFKKGGSEEPPNEIHLAFTSNGAGQASAKTTVDKEVPEGEAGSIVLHAAEDTHVMAAFVHASDDREHGEDHHGEDHHSGEGSPHHSDKIACAELEGATSPAEGGESASAAVPTIIVQNGEPVGGIQELEFNAGEEIRFKVSSDVAEEIHLHGYDIAKDVPAGGTVEFDFPAEIEGIFEAELEGLGVQILELRVNP